MSAPIVKHLAKLFVERSEHLGLKGKKRDDAVLEFFCGAATALENVGHVEEAQAVTVVASMILATRGYLGLINIVQEPAEAA